MYSSQINHRPTNRPHPCGGHDTLAGSAPRDRNLLGRLLLVAVLVLIAGLVQAGQDFNGDGRDDIVSFARNSWAGNGAGNVYVALSTGGSFSGYGQVWHDTFGYNKEIPATGDFNGDGKDDIVAFIRSSSTNDNEADVWVSLSSGSSFVGSSPWHDEFAVDHQIPGVGDFNGDGRDDIIHFNRSLYGGDIVGNVYVSISYGSYFGPMFCWTQWFGINDEIPAVGDFNGDGKDDIVTFVRDTQSGSARGNVYVALSNGYGFLPGQKWHEFFSIGNELPLVGDFNGDGKDDIATMVRSAWSGASAGDVFVALSNGSSFTGTGVRWHHAFGAHNDVPQVGDFNGDGRDDLALFYHDGRSGSQRGDVWVTLSTGTSFGSAQKWHDFFCVGDEVPTTMAAVFPYHVFRTPYEDSDATAGGYASNEEDRFPDNVYDFLAEFSTTWPYTQYYWAYPNQFLTDRLSYVDSVDIAFVSGHGNVSYMALTNGAGVSFTNAAWGSWSSNSRKGDLEYIAFESCKVLSRSGDWRRRWKASPSKAGPFSGLHLALGFHNNHHESPVFELSDEFAENLEDGFSVRWGWMEATDDENDWVWGHDNIGIAMYIRPHKYEGVGGHGSRDRWYHDSDYILDASYWVY